MKGSFRYATPLIPLLALFFMVAGCGKNSRHSSPVSVRIIDTHPHDSTAYTQGLLIQNGRLYESTGLYQESTVREIEAASGNVLRKLDLPPTVFGEGLAFHDGRLFCLTWRKGVAYELDPATFSMIKKHLYQGEGWGLTSDGKHLIMSDGTSTLRFIDPELFSVVKTLQVKQDNKPVMNINELEFVDGIIYANIYTQDRIVLIHSASGHVVSEIDLSGLRAQLPTPNHAEVLNGIAYDPSTGHFFITGKRWPTMFEMEFKRSKTR